MTWTDIPGWSSDIEPFYAHLATRLPHGARFAEIGVLFGRSIACLGTLRPDLELYAIDTWDHGDREGIHAEYQGKWGPTTWEAFLAGMSEHAPEVFAKLHVVRAPSTSVSVTLGVHGCFIDADHEYPGVQADITHWRSQVRPGGVLAGHDYGEHFPGVLRAVNEAFGKRHTMGPGDWTSVWVAP